MRKKREKERRKKEERKREREEKFYLKPKSASLRPVLLIIIFSGWKERGKREERERINRRKKGKMEEERDC